MNAEVIVETATQSHSSFIVIRTTARDGAVTPASTQRLDTVDLGSQASASGRSLDSGLGAQQIDEQTDGLSETVPLRFAAESDDVHQGESRKSVDSGGPPNCIGRLKWKRYLGLRRSFVARHYDNKMTGVSHRTFTNSAAESKVGIAVSPTGKFGSFKLGGDQANEISSSVEYGASSDTRRDYTFYKYNLYYRNCKVGPRWFAKPNGFATGTSSTRDSKIPAAWKCSNYTKGTTATLNRKRAWRNYYGVDLQNLGVNVSAETGYTSAVGIVYKFFGTNGRLCGTVDVPNNGNGNIYVARNR